MEIRQAIGVYFGKHTEHINKMATDCTDATAGGQDDLGFNFLPEKNIYLLP